MSEAMFRPHTFPVSIKGVCVRDNRVLLPRNEPDEWELPGVHLANGSSETVVSGKLAA